jgi:hypothetical protein
VVSAKITFRAFGRVRCAWCREHGDLESAEWGSCPTDQTVLHLACAEEFGECPVCRENLSSVRARTHLTEQRERVSVRVLYSQNSDRQFLKQAGRWAALTSPVPGLVMLRLGAAALLVVFFPFLGMVESVSLAVVISLLAYAPLRSWGAWRSPETRATHWRLLETAQQLRATDRVLGSARREVRKRQALLEDLEREQVAEIQKFWEVRTAVADVLEVCGIGMKTLTTLQIHGFRNLRQLPDSPSVVAARTGISMQRANLVVAWAERRRSWIAERLVRSGHAPASLLVTQRSARIIRTVGVKTAQARLNRATCRLQGLKKRLGRLQGSLPEA